MRPRPWRSSNAARPSSASGGCAIALSPTASRKPATACSPSHGCRQVSGEAREQRTRSSVCTKSSSGGSRRRPCCRRQKQQRCCSGRCSPLVRSTCARLMVGRRLPQSPSISRLTSPPDRILSKCRRSRHRIPTPLATPPVLGHGTVNVVRPNHSLRGAEAPEALDEQKLLDRLGQASRGKRDTAATKTLKIGGCKLDLAGHTFFDGKGRETQLTRAQIRLLAAFLDTPRHVLSRDQLSHAVFGHGAELYDRNVDILVARLRRKIEPDAKSPAFILTVPGVGYKFAVQPQSVEDSKSLPATDPEQFNRPAGGVVMPASG